MITPIEKLRNLATKLGLASIQVEEIEDYGYDGKGTIYYSAFGNYKSADEQVKRTSNLAHDIAHWLVADPERRSLPEFGLGSSPETALQVKRVIPAFSAAKEEGYASFIGMVLERWAGQDPKKFTYDEHNWSDSTIAREIPVIAEKFGYLLAEDPEGFIGLTFNESAVL